MAFTTLEAHRFNSSLFTERFERITKKLKFERIYLKQNVADAAKTILTDKRHLDNNPKIISEKNIINILQKFKIEK